MPMTREQILQQENACRVFQARADAALEPWGVRAPAPAMSNDPNYPEIYRRELAIMCMRRIPAKMEFTGLRPSQPEEKIPASVLFRMLADGHTFEVAEPLAYEACKQAARRNDAGLPGEMRMVERVDPQNGRKFTEFFGRSFIHDFKSPVRRVLGFLHTGGRYWNTGGRYL
jgi:hypothetical protein